MTPVEIIARALAGVNGDEYEARYWVREATAVVAALRARGFTVSRVASWELEDSP